MTGFVELIVEEGEDAPKAKLTYYGLGITRRTPTFSAHPFMHLGTCCLAQLPEDI